MAFEKKKIAAGEDTPAIITDENYLHMEGPSFPENAIDFYGPISSSLSEIEAVSAGTFIAEFDFSILSSASNKMIFEMLVKLEKLFLSGKDVKVRWYYEPFDEDMLEEGEGFKETLKIPFELIEK